MRKIPCLKFSAPPAPVGFQTFEGREKQFEETKHQSKRPVNQTNMSDMDTDSDSGIDDTLPQSYPQYIPQLEYTSPPTRLQTLDLWLPRPLEESDPTTTVFIM
jgi:hypothetical protein